MIHDRTTRALQNQGVKWITVKEYVDIDTGVQITKQEFINNYYIVNKTKYYDVNKIKTRGKVTICNECRRHNQGKLF